MKNFKLFHRFFPVLAALGIVATGMAPAHAATVAWQSAVSGNWSDGTKGSGGAAPTSADHVVINVDGTYTVTL